MKIEINSKHLNTLKESPTPLLEIERHENRWYRRLYRTLWRWLKFEKKFKSEWIENNPIYNLSAEKFQEYLNNHIWSKNEDKEIEFILIEEIERVIDRFAFENYLWVELKRGVFSDGKDNE